MLADLKRLGSLGSIYSIGSLLQQAVSIVLILIYTAFLLGKIAFRDFNIKSFPIILTSAIVCYFVNIALGFLVGLILYLIFRNYIEETNR